MSLPTLILASTSPRRSELLRQCGVTFEVLPSHVEEIHHEQLTAEEMCRLNAYHKARRVSKKHPDALVMGCDTLVALDNRVFGKPATLEEAQNMLLELQGKTHLVITGVCLIHLRSHHQEIFAERTLVTFHPLTLDQIKAYHAKVNPLDKAGAYGIQLNGDEIVEKISGSFSNVVGLPMERLQAQLAHYETVTV